MAKVSLSPEMQKAIANFFKGEIKVFEAGDDAIRPARIQDRPFFDVLPENETAWLYNAKVATKAGNMRISLEKPLESSSLSTESHEFLKEMEDRFRKVQPGAKLFIIDPDVIQGRYATDTSRNRSLGKAIVEYLHEKLVTNEVKDQKAEPGDEAIFMDAAFAGNSPFSMPLKTGVTPENILGTGSVAIVVASNPDKPMHELWTEVPGAKERFEASGLDYDVARRIILYHELGHAMDPRPQPHPITADLQEVTMRRYETESFADAHATLQIARDTGSVDAALLFSDIRATFMYEAMVHGLPQTRMQTKLTGITGPYWAAKMQEEEERRKHGLDKKDPQQTQLFAGLEKNAKQFSDLNNISQSVAYHVNPVSDAAIEFAKKGLADGSLMKMTDKEVLDACVKLVDENKLSQDRINAMSVDILTGNINENPDLVKVQDRFQEAMKRMPLPAKKLNELFAQREQDRLVQREIAIQQSLGIQLDLQAPKMPAEDVKSLKEWINNVVDEVGKRGGDENAIVEVATAEKDSLRNNESDHLAQIKISLINNSMIAGAPELTAKAKARGIVNKTLQEMPAPKIDETLSGKKLLNSYLSNELETISKAEKAINRQSDRDTAALSVDELIDALKVEKKDYTEVLASEKTSQTLAFRVRSDKEAWEAASKSPEVKDMVTAKATNRHSGWIDAYHVNLGEKQAYRSDEILQDLSKSRRTIKYSQTLLNTTEKTKPEATADKDAVTKKIASSAKNKGRG